MALVSGIGIGQEWERLFPHKPTPRYVQFDCYQDQRQREPWELYPDGQVLQVGNWHYLVEVREVINSPKKPRYDGNQAFGFMVKIEDFDRRTVKTECPRGWK